MSKRNRGDFPMSSNLSLSLELIKLLDFLLKYKGGVLQRMVREAVASGCLKVGGGVPSHDGADVISFVNDTIVEFIEFLEAELLDSVNAGTERGSGLHEQLIASIEKLDCTDIDPRLVWQSVQEAQSELKGRSVSDRAVRSVLFRRILEHWTPADENLA